MISNIIDDLATFFEQLAETREAVMKKREIQEQLRKTEEAQKVMKQQLQRSRLTPKNQEKDLFGDVNDPESAISTKVRVAKTQRLLESHGTRPNFYVVVQK